MKQKFFFPALFFGAALTASAAGGNLLSNGDFESGKANWNANEWSNPRGEFDYSIVSENPGQGKFSARIKHISGRDNLVLGQNLSCKGGQLLRLDFMARCDVRTSTEHMVQATYVTVDASGKLLEEKIHDFTATDSWNTFSWSFQTHPDAVTLSIYLRCDKVTTYFDDVVLTEASGVSLENGFYWPGSAPEFVLEARNSGDMTQDGEYFVQVFSQAKRKMGKAVPVKLAKGGTFLEIPAKFAPGSYTAALVDAKGKVSSESTIVIPPAKKFPANRLNNFVRMIRRDAPAKLAPNAALVFENPRAGWVWFKFEAAEDGKVAFPKANGDALALTAGKTVETMRYYPAGKCELAAETALELKHCEIRSVPELMMEEYEGQPSHQKYYAPLMRTVAIAEILKNTNCVAESFENSTAAEPDFMRPEAAARIAQWRAEGRKVISHAVRLGKNAKNPDFDKSYEYWSTRIGTTELDGIEIDEFGNETADEVPTYTEAIKRFYANGAHAGKTVYAYGCAAWGSHEQTMELRKYLHAGGGASAPEYYLREKRTSGEAKSNINFMFGYLRDWEKTTPGSLPYILMTLSSTDGLPGYYGQDTMANANYKVYLDLQYYMLANAPEFDGLRGVTQWVLRYTRPETVAWIAMLNRHYCIEGNTDLLSKRFGFDYNFDYVKNPDFADGTANWTLEPAAESSMKLNAFKNWGFGRGTCNTAPDGDAVMLMKRVPGKVNQLKQTVTGLVPGKWYELQVRVADFDDVSAGKRVRKLLPLKAELSGITFDPELSAIDVYQSDHPMAPHYPKYNDGACANELTLYFKATAPTAELTLSDECATPGIKAGNYVHEPFETPAPEEVKTLMFNFIQLQPILPPELWHTQVK